MLTNIDLIRSKRGAEPLSFGNYGSVDLVKLAENYLDKHRSLYRRFEKKIRHKAPREALVYAGL